MNEPPFQFGQKVWAVSGSHYGTRDVPCSMCFGKRQVWLILGDDSRVCLQCDACRRGCNGPSGLESIHEPYASCEEVEVTGMELKDGEWKVSVQPYQSTEHLFADEATAREFMVSFLESLKDQAEKSNEWAMQSRRKAKWPWSVKYHRQCIERAEREIEWHRAKISERKKP